MAFEAASSFFYFAIHTLFFHIRNMLVTPTIGQGKRGKGDLSSSSRASSVGGKTSAKVKEGSLRYIEHHYICTNVHVMFACILGMKF